MEELLSRNVVNIFSTPLSLAEWIAAMMVLGLINIFFVIACCSLAIWLLYGINIFILGIGAHSFNASIGDRWVVYRFFYLWIIH